MCSITTTVLPWSTSLFKTDSNFFTSSKCKPVVGSSKMYNVLPVALFESSLESLILWASPPDSVVAAWPNLI